MDGSGEVRAPKRANPALVKVRRKVSAVSDQQDELKEAFIAILKQVGELFNSSGESQLVTVLNMGVFAAAGLKQLEKDCREFFDAGGAKTISIAVETLRGLQEKLLPLVSQLSTSLAAASPDAHGIELLMAEVAAAVASCAPWSGLRRVVHDLPASTSFGMASIVKAQNPRRAFELSQRLWRAAQEEGMRGRRRS